LFSLQAEVHGLARRVAAFGNLAAGLIELGFYAPISR
jgi:hypothetical protein